MARTFNRPPVQVNTPSGNDVKNYFFNHYNWKGLTDNKNVLAVDQETFSDCKNVYIDSEGLLRSRPSLKIKTVTYDNQCVLSDITNIWTFGDVTVYESKPNDNYFLTFINKNFPNNTIQQSFTHNDYKLVLYDKKIFVFAKDGFYYYSFGNLSTNETPVWNSASSYVHIPVTSIVVNGIPTDVDVEDLNVLTNSYITKYIYDSISSNDNFSSFIGKTVTITLDNIDYDVTFVENNNLVFVNKYFSLDKNNFSDDYIYGDGGADVPLVDFSDDGSIILSSYSKNQNNDYDWKIYYSTNNVLFEQLPYLDGVLGPAKITKDGNNAIVFLSDGPYIYSLRKYKYINNSDVIKEFDSWTNLLKFINKTDYENMNIFIQYGALVNGSFVSSSDFSFCYTSNYKYDFILITSLDNRISQKILFSSSLHIQIPTTSSKTFTPLELLPIYSIEGRYVIYRSEKQNMQINYTSDSSMSSLRLEFTTASAKGEAGTLLPDWNEITGKVYNGSSVVDVISIREYSTDMLPPNIDRTTKYFKFNTTDSGSSFSVTVTPLEVNSKRVEVDNKILVHSNYKPLIDFSISKQTGELSYNCCVLFVAKDKSDTNYYKYLCITNGTDILYDRITEVSTNIDTCLHLIKYNDVLSGSMQQYFVDGNTLANGSSNIIVNVYSNGSLSSTVIYDNNDTDIAYYCKISNLYNYIATDVGLFAYNEYPSNGTYTAIPWLEGMSLKPVYYSNTPYMYNDEFVYSYFNKKIELSEQTSGTQNYIVPSKVCELSNFYFSDGSKLYISQNYSKNGKVEWYFPNITLQNFNYNITNLHPISNTEVAIFFNDEVWYVTYDNELQAYRYTKSKLQTGCKNGSDVLTTFDGKYTIFASSRGLVAMSYQDYIASTEQSLTYLSDAIYSVFENYITDSKSSNQVKLFKFGYWIIIYKQDSNKGFIFDIRNNSWWPISGVNDAVKFVNIDDSIKLLSDGKIYELNKLDTNYFDYDGKKRTKIDWFVRSQKLHLSALNNYKHISNITFVSVHDSNILQNTEYNINELDFRLQVNCYRKKINGNINEPDDFVNVNYKVETIRTFVQRLNYSKINEFQYQLSSDEENAIEIPLSLNSITIKYKIGGQVR